MCLFCLMFLVCVVSVLGAAPFTCVLCLRFFVCFVALSLFDFVSFLVVILCVLLEYVSCVMIANMTMVVIMTMM